MAHDIERGDRIRNLRKQSHLKQQQIADAVGVTLRAYQEWQAGGGMTWENCKKLARVLGADPDYIWRGERSETPDLSLNGQLNRIEQKLDRLLGSSPDGP